MVPPRKDKWPKIAADHWLTLLVHFDALRASPRRYLLALWWFVTGKRLRARHQMAPLFSHSPRVYHLWLLREDGVLPAEAEAHGRTPILALIDVTAGQAGLNETLASLEAEGIPALQVGSEETPNLAAAASQIDWREHPWLMLLAAGDIVAPGTASIYGAAAAETAASLIYADDDILIAGRRAAPHFKPDWNGELFRHFDYLSGACILRVSGDMLEGLAASDHWLRDLTSAAAVQGAPQHIRKILHHRAARPAPTFTKASPAQWHALPPVTIIIPTRNRVDLLRKCLEGVAATRYPELDVIVVDNDSDDPETLGFLAGLDPVSHRVLRHAGAFNYSAINNRAAAEARGRLLCLLNNDIEVTDPSWLATMVTQATRQDVGAVGAQLLYPDGRIQHAGVVIGMGGAAGHAHRFLRPEQEGYFHRHALPQFATAVTAACLVVMRERFLAVGGLDEINFPVAFNDVDLCLRLNQRGWQTLYEPRARLIHHESVSRGFDRDSVGAARLAGELAALKRLWGTEQVVDPFHHPELSRASERFVVRV